MLRDHLVDVLRLRAYDSFEVVAFPPRIWVISRRGIPSRRNSMIR
ncbi:hypothetical protein SMC26_19420 [Actinomadura fulvescens]